MSVASNLCLSEHEWFITNFVGRSSDTYILSECIFKHGINYSKPQHTHTTGTTNAISFVTSRSKPLRPHLHHCFQLSLMNAYVKKPLLSMRTTLLTSMSHSTHLQQSPASILLREIPKCCYSFSSLPVASNKLLFQLNCSLPFTHLNCKRKTQ